MVLIGSYKINIIYVYTYVTTVYKKYLIYTVTISYLADKQDSNTYLIKNPNYAISHELGRYINRSGWVWGASSDVRVRPLTYLSSYTTFVQIIGKSAFGHDDIILFSYSDFTSLQNIWIRIIISTEHWWNLHAVVHWPYIVAV